MTLPTAVPAPAIARSARLPTVGAARGLDALLVVGAIDGKALQSLPEAHRWQALHRRGRANAGGIRSTTLTNTRQTAAVLAYAVPTSTMFEKRALAGRLLHELAERRPERIGLVVDASLGERSDWFEALIAAAHSHAFALPAFRRELPAPWRLRQLRLFAAPALELARIQAGARANNLARWLTALPPNKLDTRAYRRALTQLARRHRLKLRWYSERELKRLGAGAFLAVARGNAARDAGIARLSWPGNRQSRGTDVALVGKGILFDTGGTNLKAHRNMLDMHTDMAGSAVALATLVALAELRSPLRVDAWLAITENNIGPTAYRPQEVVRALNGTTIQVIHSDAEGRMALADTLALAARARPRLMLDYATLTGACVYALTERYSGVFSNRPELHQVLTQAGAACGERVWPFPLDADFDSDIDSKNADIKQCAVEGKGDHIIAARFLHRFVPKDIAWVHMDLSAATRSGGLADIPGDITGFGARYTLELLLRQAWRARSRRR